jgi:hypothetical protein
MASTSVAYPTGAQCGEGGVNPLLERRRFAPSTDAVAFLEPSQGVRELDEFDRPAVDTGTFGRPADDEPKMTALPITGP